MKDPLQAITLMIVFGLTLDYRFFSGIPGLPSLTVVELLSYAALSLLIGKFALEPEALGRRAVVLYRGNEAAIWYFIWTGLASLTSLTRSADALRYYKDLAPSLIVYVLVSVCIVNRNAIKGLVAAILSGTALNLGLGISQVLLGVPRIVELAGTGGHKLDFSGRLAGLNISTGFFLHPNGYAIFLLPMAILLVGLLLQRNGAKPTLKSLFALMLLLTGANLAGTYAKGVIAWVLIGIGILIIVKRLGRARTIVGLIIVFVGILGITLYGIGALGGGPYGTMVARYQLWKTGIRAIVTDPFILFLGNGFAQMMELSAHYSNFPYPNAHNTYINQAIYFGFPALLLYLSLAGKALKSFSKLMRGPEGSQGNAARILFAVEIALLGVYFFEPANEGVVLQAQFFTLLALAKALGRVVEAEVERPSENRPQDRYLPNDLPSGF
ncbi:MAG: hypothetical protein A2V99_03550 [Spirochaetes bacterium RBG_16_67_19]|nr:MAG: hypothetical protein A2V99_03550 [Spirochaetes bacterium RBG_16_67_19]